MEENLFFRSMEATNVDTFIDNLKEKTPRFSNCPPVNPKSFEIHYQEIYGKPGCVVWLGRKISHLTLIFWDGIIKNVVNIFLLFFQSISLLSSRIYHSRCFTKSLNNASSAYISEKINSLFVELYTIAQNFTIAFGHAYSLIDDKAGRFIIDQASLEKFGYSYRHLHEETVLKGGIFNNDKLERSIQASFFDNLLKIDNLTQNEIDTLTTTLSKLDKFEFRNFYAHSFSLRILKGLKETSNTEELQKKFDLVESICEKLSDDIAANFKRNFIDTFFWHCYFDSITQNLNEENKYKVLEMIVHLLDKIEDQKSFNSLSKDIYGAFLAWGSFYRTDFKKNFLLNNEKKFLKTFVNANPKTIVGILEAYKYQDKFYLHNGILNAQTEGTDWSERQKFLRETIREIIKDKPIVFLDYVDHIRNYHYYILDFLYFKGHAYFKSTREEYAHASKLIRAICNQKKEDVKSFLEKCILGFKEKSLKMGDLDAVEFTTTLSSDSAMKIWETLIDNFQFMRKAIEEDRLLLLKSNVEASEQTNKEIRNLMCCFKHTSNKIPKPLQLIIAGKFLGIHSPVF